MPNSSHESHLRPSSAKKTFQVMVQFLQRQAASLLLYQAVLRDEVGATFLELLESIRYADADGCNCLQAYGKFFSSLAARSQNWEEYLITQILRNQNPFSLSSAETEFDKLPAALIAAVSNDLQALQNIYECNSAVLSEWVQTVANLPVSPIVWYSQVDKQVQKHELTLLAKLQQLDNWAEIIEDLYTHYKNFGSGIFAQHQALRWCNGKFEGISYPDPVSVDSLVGYESQRDALLKNTQFLLSGKTALHVLLYGSRGSGKSSLVKSLLNYYSDNNYSDSYSDRIENDPISETKISETNNRGNLRLIEVTKSDLKDLPSIIDKLRGLPQKFIIFVDDLSFEEDDDSFKALKVVLEGNLTARPQNVIVYATSNRRHLIREFFKDRPTPKDNDEVHAWDTMQEKLSFSDRFGLTLTFPGADQITYLKIVHHLASMAHIKLSKEDLTARALQWATRHNGRSGRSAKQFIDFLQSEGEYISMSE